MSSYVPASLRRLVVVRADNLCEYCLIHHDHTFWGCEIEHIISEKHGGADREADNLRVGVRLLQQLYRAVISLPCPTPGRLCRLFHPRLDRWSDHFELSGDVIRPLTEIAEATIRLLRINDVGAAAMNERCYAWKGSIRRHKRRSGCRSAIGRQFNGLRELIRQSG